MRHHNQGDKVTTTEQRRNRMIVPTVNRFAVSAVTKSRTCSTDFLRLGGSGAPKARQARRLLCSVFVMVVGVLAFASAPALAAPVETPELTVEDSTAVVGFPSTEASLHGVLNPKAPGEEGIYQFLYNASKAGVCAGGSVAPASPGMSFGFEREEYYETVTGLTPGTEYAVCLRVENDAKTESKTSPAVSFKTPIPPEKPETVSPAASVTATTAKLEGVLDPLKAGEAGTYEFLYRVSATECEGERSSPEPAGVMSGAAKQAVSVPVTALEPNATYTFCLLARNAAGETTVGSAVHFTTLAVPPAILSESVSHHNKEGVPLATGEARLEGVVNPNNQLTECHFQYGEATVSEHEVPCEPEVLTGFGEQSVAATISGLTGAPYHYRILARNGKGEEATGSEKTVLPPEAPVKPTAPEPAVSATTATTATFHGVLDPHSNHEAEPGTYEFVYRQSASECQRVNPQTGREEDEKATPATAATGAQGETVQVPVSELLPGTTYTLCLLAKNDAGEEALGAPATFTTLTVAPAIESESAVGVTAESASLQAQVNPGGAETTYHFEYGTSEAYGQSTPESSSIGAGAAGLPVIAHLQGLQAATTYHYRVVATNTKGSTDGVDRTFTTQGSTTEVTLPDGREWEMVSPPNKQGSQIYPLGFTGGDHIQAAQNGDAITYGAAAPLAANPAGNRALDLAQGFSTRREGAGGPSWETTDITTANKAELGHFGGRTDEYGSFSSDLSLGLVEPSLDTPLPPLPSDAETTNYIRNNTTGEYEALVTAANVPPGTKFGSCESCNEAEFKFVSATPDLSHVVLESRAPLTSNAASLPQDEGFLYGLYEWSGGQIQLVSVRPASEGGEAIYGELGRFRFVRHAISNDGSRVIWGESEEQVAESSLFMRDTVRGETVKIAKDAKFETASNDASRVFFSTGDVPNEEGALEVYEVTSGTGEPLAGETKILADTGDVEGVIGASEDGSYIYFVDSGVLGDGAQHGAQEGGNNLYVEHYSETAKAWEPPMFITSGAAENSWGRGENTAVDALINMTSRVSPNGRYLAFMSEKSLTGYDNRDANSGVPDEEVFLYHAPENPSSEAGGLACASCDPTGARPVGVFDPKKEGAGLQIDFHENWAHNTWLAATIPVWEEEGGFEEIHPPVYQPRYLSDSGRLFFNSADALVPADVNGKADVYEYEPVGVGSCRPPGYAESASVVFVGKTDGCVGLISAGTSSEESSFLDASENGEDVFFLTASRLSSQDYDTNFDVYDAHECTQSSACPPPAALVPPPCATGDACKAAPTPQPTIFGSPSSETFSGAGNPAPPAPAVVKPKRKAKTVKCRKGLRRNKKGKCVKNGKAKAKRSAKGRK
jgi:hypothetical protein